jgi:hypothetical protein
MSKLIVILKIVKKYWYIIPIALFLVFFGLSKYWKNQAKENDIRADRWKSNYDNITTDYKQTKDELGRTETRVKTLSITKKELQSTLYKKNKVLADLKKELEYSNVKIKDLESTIISNLNSSNEGTTVIHDTIFKRQPKKTYDYLSVSDSYLNFEAWWMHKDSVEWFYDYNETIYYWTEMKHRLYNDKGNKRFFLWRWLWPDKHPVTTVKSLNPNSKIKAKRYKFNSK